MRRLQRALSRLMLASVPLYAAAAAETGSPRGALSILLRQYSFKCELAKPPCDPLLYGVPGGVLRVRLPSYLVHRQSGLFRAAFVIVPLP